MKLKSSDDFFIHKLLEETYKSLPENEMSKGSYDLLKYFNEQGKVQMIDDAIDPVLFNFLQQNALKFLMLKNKEKLSCFRLNTTKGDIDFPVNWSVFEKLSMALKEQKNFFHYINKTNDEDLLTEILNPFNIKTDFDIAIINYVNQPVLIFFTEENKEKFNWLKSFLGVGMESEAA